MTWVERVDHASPLWGELDVSDILPRYSPKRVSVVDGWEFVRPFRGETVRQALSGGDCRALSGGD